MPTSSLWTRSAPIASATAPAKAVASTGLNLVMGRPAYIHERMAASAVTLGGSRATPWTWFWSAIATACVIALHVPSFVHRLMDGDEAVYGAIAALLNQGGRLYA